ncbi:MAG: tetratricopeptide repeat protein [candidate division Zixibacteria bacterium]|nr:tetratricopeptide repeat protein [candidate division Zixibacteria bacterium]
MNPEKRISKSQIKQDKMVTFALKAGEYIQQNKNYFIYTVAGIVAIVAIIFFFNYLGNKKEAEATELFGKAQLAGAMNQGSLAITDYRTILDNYGSTEVASKACFFIADIYNRQRNYDSAAVFYQKFVDSYNDDKILLPAAYAGGGNAYEQIRQFEKAGEFYFKAAEIANDDYRSPDYYMAAGGAYIQAGNFAKAREAYQKVVDKYRRLQVYSEARKKIAEIDYKN